MAASMVRVGRRIVLDATRAARHVIAENFGSRVTSTSPADTLAGVAPIRLMGNRSTPHSFGGLRRPIEFSTVSWESLISGRSSVWIAKFGSSSALHTVAIPGKTQILGLAANHNIVKVISDRPSVSQAFFRNGQLQRYASGFRGQTGRMSIGDRARQNQARRLWTIAISGTVVAGFIIIVLNTFQENMMFYITPSQALEKYYLDPTKNKFRLGGLVLEGSVHNFKSSPEMEFVVTDLANEILVRYRGALPDLFREGHSVVAEGFLRPIDVYPGRPAPSNELSEELADKAKQAGCYFTAVEVLAKHDEKYMPKEVAAAIDRNRAMQEAQNNASLGSMAEMPSSPELPPPASTGKRKGVAQTPATAQQYQIPS